MNTCMHRCIYHILYTETLILPHRHPCEQKNVCNKLQQTSNVPAVKMSYRGETWCIQGWNLIHTGVKPYTYRGETLYIQGLNLVHTGVKPYTYKGWNLIHTRGETLYIHVHGVKFDTYRGETLYIQGWNPYTYRG